MSELISYAFSTAVGCISQLHERWDTAAVALRAQLSLDLINTLMMTYDWEVPGMAGFIVELTDRWRRDIATLSAKDPRWKEGFKEILLSDRI